MLPYGLTLNDLDVLYRGGTVTTHFSRAMSCNRGCPDIEDSADSAPLPPNLPRVDTPPNSDDDDVDDVDRQKIDEAIAEIKKDVKSTKQLEMNIMFDDLRTLYKHMLPRMEDGGGGVTFGDIRRMIARLQWSLETVVYWAKDVPDAIDAKESKRPRLARSTTSDYILSESTVM